MNATNRLPRCSRFSCSGVVLLGLVLGLPVALAREGVIVSPSVYVLRSLKDDVPPFVREGLLTAEDFGGSLRFERELTDEEMAHLEVLGVRLARDGARVRHVGPIYPGRIGFAQLDEVIAFPGLVQIDSEFLFRPSPALDGTRPLTGSAHLSDRIAMDLGEKPGQGIRIMDLDDGLDYYHPAFFRADGGYFAWIDVDGDGLLTPGTDAVDLDADGLAGSAETLRLIDTVNIDFSVTGSDYGTPDGQYTPGVDWIYADQNGNHKRDFGKKMGFADKSPGMGEPLFLADDVNGNLVLDLDEKLVMLNTSKVEKMFVNGKTYTYGTNLTDVDPAKFESYYPGLPGGFHGTGVSGILAGNTPLLSRYVGMAPHATLLLSDDSQKGWQNEPGLDGLIGKLDWAQVQKPDVIVMPLGTSGSSFMDGTTNFELAMDELYEQDGILIVVAAGNEGAAAKHVETSLPPGPNTLNMVLPDVIPGHEEIEFATPVILFSLYWFGTEDDLDLSLAVPGMDQPQLIEDGGGWHGNPLGNTGLVVSADTAVSQAGWCFKMLFVYSEDFAALPNGSWTWIFDNNSSADVKIHGFANDGQYSSLETLQFEKWVSASTTVSVPGTANSAITAAAYAGRDGEPEGLGMLRGYSSRGPRMDGPQAIDIAAPDDPFVPFATLLGDSLNEIPYLFGSYMAFSGTSGASPHVAGSLALLKQYRKGDSAQQLFDALTQGALVEESMGTIPNPNWGSGKLQVYNAVFGSMPPENEAPTAQAALTWSTGTWGEFDAADSSDPEGKPLQYRWDLDYDGGYETDWLDSSEIGCGYEALGTFTLKLEVRDEHGATARTLLTFTLTDEPPAAEPAGEVEADVSAESDSEVAALEPDAGSGDTAPGQSPGAQDVGTPDTLSKLGSNGCTAGPSASPLAAPAFLLALLLLVPRIVRWAVRPRPTCMR